MTPPTEFDAVLGRQSLPITSAVLGMASRYSHPEYKQFCLDMATAQFPVIHAQMRFYWEGPAVYVNDIQYVLSYTKVKCLWDEDGTRFVVYPRAYTELALMEAINNFEKDKISLPIALRMSQPHRAIAQNFLNHIQNFNAQPI